MAILNNIRKHGIFLIIIIALALFSFVLSGVIGNGNNAPKGENNIATINGVDLSREDFMKKVEARHRSMGGRGAANQAMNTVWNQELRRVIFNEQYEKLGLKAEKEQITNALREALAGNPTFQNEETGLFDNGKLQEYIASAKAAADAGRPQVYQAWLDFEENIANSVLEKNYFNLIKGGLISTLDEGELEYRFQNDNVDFDVVQIPYSKIPDEDVKVSDSEIAAYIKEHAKDFEVDPQVDIQYIVFNEDPSESDLEEAKKEIEKLIPALKNATDHEEFVNANSEINYTDRWFLKSNLPEDIAENVMALKVGDIYGPYKGENTYNLVKVFEERQMADTAKARHILIRFKGLPSAPEDVVRTKEEAKKLADSILVEVRKQDSKFAELAAEFSEDESNKDKAGDLGYFVPGNMVKPFNDFVFDNNVGDYGVVETQFGYHVIAIDELKNLQRAVKVANIVKKINPSEETINDVFSKATKFEIAAKDGDFVKLAADEKLTVKPVNKIGELDATIPGVGENRNIVTWAFNEETKIGDVKRFSIPNGYVLVQLTRKSPKGLMSVAEASAKVLPILRNKKKAAIIREGIKSTDINEVAKNQNERVRKAKAVTMANPTIVGAGEEPKVVGVAFGLKEGETSKLIDGEKGVFMIRTLKFNKAIDLPGYAGYVNQLNAKISPSVSNKVFSALKNAADIEDNRANFY